MLKPKSFLAADFGAGTLKVAEFEINETGGLRLKQFALQSLGAEGAQESAREATISKALQALLAEQGFKAKDINVCAPGFHVFSKLVKLPPVDASKVTQIIQYEAQQNVPFPLEEVVWDYQILGTMPSGELEVLLVAIKADIVEGLFRVAESAGLRLQLADVSPAALCNAFRYNYGDLEDCTMLLDIGAKTSNLLFFEKGKFFARSINVGANTITQDFGTEAKLRFPEADKIKIAEGFVSLGGAYEEPENPHQAAIAKIARQFMTRLHIQVNQTLQFYRGQQGGSAPQRLFLSGGASIMPYTAQFFAEKLNVPVEYLNPFRNVQIDPAVNLEELSKVAHAMGEVVGLGLRNLAHCPVEMNLLPASTLKWQALNQKKPYLIAAVFSLVLVVFASGFLFQRLSGVKREQTEELKKQLQQPLAREARFKRVHNNLKAAQKNVEQLAHWAEGRRYWADIFGELRRVMIQAEEKTRRELRVDTGVWVERFTSGQVGVTNLLDTFGNPLAPPGGAVVPPAGIPEGEAYDSIRKRYGIEAPPAADPSLAPGTPPVEGGGSNDVTMVCRAVSLQDAANNPRIPFAVLNELKASPLFDPEGTQLKPDLGPVDANGTFTFEVTLKLLKPLQP